MKEKNLKEEKLLELLKERNNLLIKIMLIDYKIKLLILEPSLKELE